MIQALKKTTNYIAPPLLTTILALTLLAPTNSIAYSCWNTLPAQQKRDNSDYVFTGRIKKITNEEISENNTAPHQSLTVNIAKIWKGDFKGKDYTTIIADDIYEYTFGSGDKYLFYGYSLDQENVTIVGCPRSTPANTAQKDIRNLGKAIIDHTDDTQEFNSIVLKAQYNSNNYNKEKEPTSLLDEELPTTIEAPEFENQQPNLQDTTTEQPTEYKNIDLPPMPTESEKPNKAITPPNTPKEANIPTATLATTTTTKDITHPTQKRPLPLPTTEHAKQPTPPLPLPPITTTEINQPNTLPAFLPLPTLQQKTNTNKFEADEMSFEEEEIEFDEE